MEDDLDYSTGNLEHCSYRYLQQLAKSMNLPSNVKKIQLIEMINAKKCCSEAEVAEIVRRVKQQRQHLSQVKKRNQRIVQVDTSDSESGSPPITITPKRPVVVRCNPELRQVIISQNSLLQTTRPGSDRVLRSYHIKPVNTYVKQMLVETGTKSKDQATQMSTMRIVRKYKPNILSNSHAKDRQLVPVSQMPTSVLVKRPRLLSGIYPIKDMNFHVQSVGVRNREGKMSKINAYIHKPHEEASESAFSNKIKKNIEVTIQDIINDNVDAQANMQSLNYPNTSGVSVSEAESYSDLTFDTSVYYHKKIRAEQVRERRESAHAHARCELPRINDAFGQFRALDASHDVTQPLYVQVSEDSERIDSNATISLDAPALGCGGLLEPLYNLRRPPAPAPAPAPRAHTACVYSTPTLPTAVALTPAAVCTEPYVSSFDLESQYQYNIDGLKMNDSLRFADPGYDFRCHEVASVPAERATPSSSLGTARSPELGGTVTISDMVEDALELISQDGDYIERMGMDVRMQCVLCNWAGPMIILEHHIRKVHSSQIEKQEAREWAVSYRVGSVARREWSCRVLEHRAALYVLSVKHDHPDHFLASLSTLSWWAEPPLGCIRARGAGAAHAWRGRVRALAPGPRAAPGLRLPLAALRPPASDLALHSPTQLTFGQEFSDVHVVLYVKVSV